MRKYLCLAIILLLVAVIAVSRGKRKPQIAEKPTLITVSVGYARIGSMDDIIEVSGDVKALKFVSLSAKIMGRVISVPYREGDSVRSGATVIQQDTSDLRTQVQQAEAAVQSARARLSQAITGKIVSDTQADSQVAQAKAALDAARARLTLLKKGARTEERAQAENAVASAKANFENAKVNLERMRGLYSEGALSKQQMDLVQMQYDVASAQYDSARQQLSIVQAGAREEEIEAAQKQVDQAEEALRVAKANLSQKELRREDIASARAGVAQAEASLAYARQQLANAAITTPIAGTVSKRLIEPGEMATPGMPLMELVALNTVYFDASVSEIEMHKIKLGQPVQTEIDALPGRKFMGSVLKILPTADPKTRQFHVWIAVPNPEGELRPGMFARGNIRVGRHADTVIVPKDALMINGRGYTVYTVTDSVAHLRPVTLGFQNREDAEVLSGLSSGDAVVVSGQDKLSDGVKVNVAD